MEIICSWTCYLKWWLIKIFADAVDTLCMYKKIGDDDCIENWLTFQDSSDPLVFDSTTIVCQTGSDIRVTNHAVLT